MNQLGRRPALPTTSIRPAPITNPALTFNVLFTFLNNRGQLQQNPSPLSKRAVSLALAALPRGRPEQRRGGSRRTVSFCH